MQGSAEILQEYLVKLGSQVDASSYLKFNENLSSTQKRVLGLGTAAATAVAATVAATTKFAYEMRKAYFSAELAGTTPSGLSAFGKAAQQIGISSGEAEASLRSFGGALRETNAQALFPTITGGGLTGDTLQDYLNLLESLKKLEAEIGGPVGHQVAASFAAQFGLSEEQYTLMSRHLDELKMKSGDFKNQQDKLFTPEDQAKLKDYANSVDDLSNSFVFLGEALLLKVGPVLQRVINHLINANNLFKQTLLGDKVDFAKGVVSFAESGKKLLFGESYQTPKDVQDLLGGNTDVDKFLKGIKGVESSGGDYGAKNPRSSASGAYQFIDSTWQALTKKYGMGQEFSSARQAPKEVQDAIARKYAEELLKQYGGNATMAANTWYTGNPQGTMTAEQLAANKGFNAQDYQGRFNRSLGGSGAPGGSNSVVMNNNFNITGGDANATARAVAMEIGRKYGDTTRYTQGLQP